MSSRSFALVFAILLLVPTAVPVGATSLGTQSASDPDSPHVEAVCPNPLADEDAGEYVVLDFPERTNLSEWSLSDGEATIPLSNTTVEGRVAVTAEPNATGNLTDEPLLVVNDSLSLANSGDEVSLFEDEEVVDEMSYGNAPDAEIFARSADGWTWQHLGTTNFSAVRTDVSRARVFVLPDAPEVPIDVLGSAQGRVLLAGYSFESESVARALKRAAERGVEVRTILDDAPVGGISAAQAQVLDDLTAAGVAVEVIGGDWARYDYHHPKYAVVDDRALVMTENWKPSGTGGHSSRGWGAVVRGETANELAAIFRADADWRDTASWEVFSANQTFETDERTNESYPTNFVPKTVPVDGVQLLAALDNAEATLIERLDDADESIEVVQASIDGQQQPFLQAAIRAAERGVHVRILLSSEWYTEEENGALADWLNAKAETENLPLEAKIADPGSRFEKIHAKGVVIDREAVVVGSMNWNNNSARENREIALVLDGKAAGKYYGRVFDDDWEGEQERGLDVGDESPLPVGVVAAVVGVTVLAGVIGKQIRFE